MKLGKKVSAPDTTFGMIQVLRVDVPATQRWQAVSPNNAMSSNYFNSNEVSINCHQWKKSGVKIFSNKFWKNYSWSEFLKSSVGTLCKHMNRCELTLVGIPQFYNNTVSLIKCTESAGIPPFFRFQDGSYDSNIAIQNKMILPLPSNASQSRKGCINQMERNMHSMVRVFQSRC